MHLIFLSKKSTWILLILLGIILFFGGYVFLRKPALSADFASGNGRLEAVDIDISTKIPGRVKTINVNEGDYVKAGEILAVMETQDLEAELKEAIARKQEAESQVTSMLHQEKQREYEKKTALSLVSQNEASFHLAQKRLARIKALFSTKAISEDQLDEVKAHFRDAQAKLNAAQTQVASAEASIDTTKSLAVGATSRVAEMQATIERIQTDLNEAKLLAPTDGRIQFRIAEPGEVLSAGSHVLNMIKLDDTYMRFYLSTDEAGKVRIGAPVHIVLDAYPKHVIPASVSFVSAVAQFTPKTVETKNEREKLMFLIKARLSPTILKKYPDYIKIGLPGVAYVQLTPNSKWPENLAVNTK